MINQVLNPRPIVVPTDDSTVRRLLRDLDDVATYFGEGPAERRERLARILADLPPDERLRIQATIDVNNALEGPDSKEQTFYYEGSEALKEARYIIAEYSIQQSSSRLDMARLKQSEPLATRLIPKQDLIEKIRQIDDPESYVDGDASATELKTFTSCSFNPDATLVCSSYRSGRCKIWSLPHMETLNNLRGHQQSANFITFSPLSGNQLAPTVANLASCAMDGSILLWNLVEDVPHTQLSGPQPWRVTRVKYHPCGQYLASCCSDNSWRLWDLKAGTEILHQEGHSDAVFDLAFHPDGSLAGSASMDSLACVWDLRTGRGIHLLEGHSKGLRTIDFSPDGYHIATGSLDNSVKIWNLRQRKVEYTIPAHVNAVTTVMFEKENGFYLATSSFDKTVKFWSSQTWAPIKTLDAYDDKVARIDISTTSDRLVSCYSKYLKLWSVPVG
jgi:U4/U6 small nuclear ribonucleoprotein PRP4